MENPADGCRQDDSKKSTTSDALAEKVGGTAMSTVIHPYGPGSSAAAAASAPAPAAAAEGAPNNDEEEEEEDANGDD